MRTASRWILFIAVLWGIRLDPWWAKVLTVVVGVIVWIALNGREVLDEMDAQDEAEAKDA
jgi:predicted membrane protein